MNINTLIRNNFKIIAPYESVEAIEEDLLRDSFVVIMDQNRYIGLLTPSDVLESAHTLAIDCLHEIIHLEYGADLNISYNLMRENRLTVLPVFKKKEFIGVLKESDITKYLQHFYNDILENIRDVVWSVSWPEMNILYISRSAEIIYGRPIREFYEQPSLWIEAIHEDDKHLVDKSLKQLMENGTAENERRIIMPDGGIKWIYDKSKLIYDKDSRPVRIDGIAADISERKLMEKTIWEKNNLLNSLIESTSDSIYVKDLDGNYQLFNKSAGQFTGKNSSDVIGRNDAFIFPPPEASAIITSDHEILKTGNVETIEETLTAASGEIITFLTTKGPIFDAEGKVAGLFGIARDISYLKKIEETLRKSERNYSTLVENSTDMIARFDKDFNCIFYNRAAGKYTGIPINRLCITDYLKTDTSLDETDFIFIECLKNVFETGMDIDVEERFITPDGEIYFQTEIIPEYNGDRRIETILIVSRDITEKKYDENKLEQYRNHLEELIQLRTAELTESEKRYREITNSITDYVYQVKIDEKKNVLTNYTEGCYPITGYHSLEFTKDPYLWHNTVYPEDQNNVKMFISNIYKDPDCKTVIEHRIVHKEGSIKWINNTVVIHRNSEGDLTGYDGVIRDITERKTAEEEIVNLNRHIIKLQEEERQRVAQDLHDSVGQSIIAAKMNIDTYKQDKNYFAEQLDVGLSFLIKASQELRDIYTGLYPTVLNDFGFEKAIKWLLQNTVEKFSIKTDVNISIADKIPHNIEVGLYRIIQEIISNILKHASASAVQINLTSNENMVTLVVKDNGVGFKSAVKKTGINGYGLANIKNRIISFNGQISIEKNTPTGVSIIIVINLLPMNKSHNSK